MDNFEQGKYYSCIRAIRPSGWNPAGKMDIMLDGKPRKATKVFVKRKGVAEVHFEGIKGYEGGNSYGEWEWKVKDFKEGIPTLRELMGEKQ